VYDIKRASRAGRSRSSTTVAWMPGFTDWIVYRNDAPHVARGAWRVKLLQKIATAGSFMG
jgi:hypothetical protein